MADSKNPVTNMVDTQTKSVQNFIEASKKWQESVMRGEFDKGVDIYRSWFDEQRHITENAIKEGTEAMTNSFPGATPAYSANDVYRRFTDTQAQYAKQFVNMFQGAPATPPSMGTFADNYLLDIRRMYDQWTNMYQQWFSQSTKQFTTMREFMSGQAGQSALKDIADSMQTYTKMFEVWQPMAQMMQENAQKMASAMQPGQFNVSAFTSLIDPSKYREAMDNVFKFAPVEQFKTFYDQMNHFVHNYLETFKDMQEQGRAQMAEYSKTMMPWTGNLGEAASNVTRQMEQIYAPFRRMMPAGREKETFETALALRDKYAEYWSKTTEIQYQMYHAGQRAMEQIMEEMLEKAKNGETVTNYNEFFNHWVNITENHLLELFNSDDFSKSQGEMLTLGMEIKRTFEQQMEKSLEGFPVVTRSEADSLAKTVADLRKQVRTLEKSVKETAAENNTEKAVVPVKKPATRRKAASSNSGE